MSFKTLSLFNRFVVGFLFALIIAVSFFGFDTTDEGFMLLLAEPDQPLGWSFTYAPKILSFFVSELNFGIVEFRLLRLLLLLFCTSYFARALVKFCLSRDIPVPKGTFWVILLFGFTSYIIFPNTISYNILSFNLAQLSGGLILFEIANPRSRWQSSLITTFFLAICTVVLAYSKITSGLAMFALINVYFFLIWLIKRRRNILRFTVFYAILSALTCIATIWIFPESHFFKLFNHAIESASLSSTHGGSMIVRNFLTFIKIGAAAAIAGSINAVVIRYGRFPSGLVALLFSLGLDVLGLFGLLGERLNQLFGAFFFYLFGFFLVLLFEKNRAFFVDIVMAQLFLIGLSICVFIGTNNPNLLVFSLASGLCWPLLLMLSLELLKGGRVIILLASTFLAMAVSLQLTWLRYRQPPVWEQTERIALPHGMDLFLSKNAIDLFTKYQASLEKLGFEKGDPVYGLYKMPGIVYYVEGYSPGGVVWAPSHEKVYLNFLNREELPERAFMTFTDITLAEEFSELLNYRIDQVIYFEDSKNGAVRVILK